MNNSETTESATTTVEQVNIAFGEPLREARQARGLSLEEVSGTTHLSVPMIDAIEKSDVSSLPPPTFVQGYLRIYARFLGLPEAAVVEDFNRAIPHKQETELNPRSSLPSQANSHSPLMRSVTIVLLLFVMLALVYGAYDYYAKTAVSFSQEKTDETTTTLGLPGYEQDEVQQHAIISEDGELIVVAPERVDSMPADDAATEDPTTGLSATQELTGAVASTEVSMAEDVDSEVAVFDSGLDSLELRPRNDSWVEIVDATNSKLYHNLVQKDQVLHLQGVAPFDVFLGNAPAVQLLINAVEVKMTRYIRPNNVARFSVSTSNGRVVFH